MKFLYLASALTVGTQLVGGVANDNGLLEVIFENAPTDNFASIYWGLKWAGDHETFLNGLVASNDLSATTLVPNTAVQIDYIVADNATYVHLVPVAVPEPAGFTVLSCGLLALVRRRLG